MVRNFVFRDSGMTCFHDTWTTLSYGKDGQIKTGIPPLFVSPQHLDIWANVPSETSQDLIQKDDFVKEISNAPRAS